MLLNVVVLWQLFTNICLYMCTIIFYLIILYLVVDHPLIFYWMYAASYSIILLVCSCILSTCFLLNACTIVLYHIIGMQVYSINLFAIGFMHHHILSHYWYLGVFYPLVVYWMHGPSYSIILLVCRCILSTCLLLDGCTIIGNKILLVCSCILFTCLLLHMHGHVV